MTEYINIVVPSKPEMVSESNTEGKYVISNLYPGYGNTLGNALRRMLLSSIPGVTITTVRIKGVPHEFSTISGVKEDVLTIILNLKNIKLKGNTDSFPQVIKLNKKGVGPVTANDFDVPSQLEIINKDFVIAEITDPKTELVIEADVYRGIGFRSREDLKVENDEVGSIVMDTTFSPVVRASYEVQNMRVGDRTDFNSLTMVIVTDGTVSPRIALEKALKTMISQFEAMLVFQKGDDERMHEMEKEAEDNMKIIKIHDLRLSASVVNTLEKNNINTVMDVLKRGTAGIKDIPGIGTKALEEIMGRLEDRGIVLKDK